MARTIKDFAGEWRIRREIDDRLIGQRGAFQGAATLSPKGEGVWIWSESGLVRLGDGKPLKAERRYVWRDEGERISVLFEDGRRFHDFVPGVMAQAVHWCDPDDYRVQYDFGSWPDWQSVWTVRGPRKDYTMTSHHFRGQLGAGPLTGS